MAIVLILCSYKNCEIHIPLLLIGILFGLVNWKHLSVEVSVASTKCTSRSYYNNNFNNSATYFIM